MQVVDFRLVAFESDWTVNHRRIHQREKRRIHLRVLESGAGSTSGQASVPGKVTVGDPIRHRLLRRRRRLPATSTCVGLGRGTALRGPHVVAAGDHVVAVDEVARDAGGPHGAAIHLVHDTVRHRMTGTARRPVDNGDLRAAEDAVVHVDTVAVRDDRDVIRIGGVLPGQDALGDLEIVEAAVETADAVQPLDDAWTRTLDHGQSEDTKSTDRDVARLDQHPVSRAAERIGTAVPGVRQRHGVNERRHAPDVPIRIVGQDLGTDGQPVGPRKGPALWAEQRRFTDAMDPFGEHDGHRTQSCTGVDAPGGFSQRLERSFAPARVGIATCRWIHIQRVAGSHRPVRRALSRAQFRSQGRGRPSHTQPRLQRLSSVHQ